MQTQQSEITAGPQNSRDGQMTTGGVSSRQVCVGPPQSEMSPRRITTQQQRQQQQQNLWNAALKHSPEVETTISAIEGVTQSM